MQPHTPPATSAHPAHERMPRIDALTGLRWWAAFFVFTYHMLVFAPLPGVASTILGQGFYGVTFFFVLSGFVLTWSLSPRVSQSTFYWRRFARVYPAHLVALLLAVPVFYAVSPDPAEWWVKPLSIGVLLLSVVLLQGWSNDPTILFSGNPAAWTLTCEAFFYALHPYISRILTPLRSRGALVFIATTVVVLFVYRALAVAFPEAWFSGLPLPLVRVTEFAIGMGLAWAVRCGWRPTLPSWFGVGAMVASVLVVCAALWLSPISAVARVVAAFGNEIVTIGCAVAVLAIAVKTLRGARSLLAHPVAVKLGEWSFTFYLVHATIIYTVLSVLGPRPESWLNLLWFAALFVPSLIAAALLHRWVERPIEKRMRRWKDRRDSRAAQEVSHDEAPSLTVDSGRSTQP